MGKETSKRIQTSLLNGVEKKALIWLAQRQPAWITSDCLTYFGVFGSVLFAVGGYLANENILYLWLSVLGLVIHWYGDSLDGTLARVRDTQRPLYGFFIDHTLDAVTTALICIGAGLSPMFRMDVALFVLSGYLCLSLYTYICVILKEEFKLTYGKFGPTEFRLLLILLCILYMYMPWGEWHCEIGDIELGVYDIAGAVISAILFLIYLVQFVGDLRYFGQRDPLKGAKK